MTATGLHHHIAVFLENDIVAGIVIKDRSGAQLCGGTAGLGDAIGLHQVHQGLQDGMVGGIHAGVQWEGTLPLTVIGRVALRCNDPVQPTKVLKANVELMSPANLPALGSMDVIKDPWEFVWVREVIAFFRLPFL